jgi:hypothetical protein
MSGLGEQEWCGSEAIVIMWRNSGDRTDKMFVLRLGGGQVSSEIRVEVHNMSTNWLLA